MKTLQLQYYCNHNTGHPIYMDSDYNYYVDYMPIKGCRPKLYKLKTDYLRSVEYWTREKLVEVDYIEFIPNVYDFPYRKVFDKEEDIIPSSYM